MVVIGILAVITAYGLFTSMDFWKNYSFRSERNLIVSILQEARMEAMTNINQTSHGVYFEAAEYVAFEGPLYNPLNPTNKKFPANGTLQKSGMIEVRFDQLS